MNLILYGPPGTRAAECAEGLAARLGRQFAAVEAAVEAVDGRPAAAIAVESGIARLRSLESAVALALLESMADGDDRILALGSACLGDDPADEEFAAVRRSLDGLRDRGARTVYLTANLAALAKRAGLDGPRFSSVASPRRILLRQLAARAPVRGVRGRGRRRERAGDRRRRRGDRLGPAPHAIIPTSSPSPGGQAIL